MSDELAKWGEHTGKSVLAFHWGMKCSRHDIDLKGETWAME